jgi:hypothetical protein
MLRLHLLLGVKVDHTVTAGSGPIHLDPYVNLYKQSFQIMREKLAEEHQTVAICLRAEYNQDLRHLPLLIYTQSMVLNMPLSKRHVMLLVCWRMIMSGDYVYKRHERCRQVIPLGCSLLPFSSTATLLHQEFSIRKNTFALG